jgi:hypothetical protein
MAVDGTIATGNFNGGFAKVRADDPRVLVGAFLTCKRDRATGFDQIDAVRALTNIPAFPVGATAQYFQAGMPSTWAPPMVRPEVP